MRCAAAFVAAAFLLTACANGSRRGARLSAHDDLSAIRTLRAALKNGTSGAPVDGLTISGIITNTGSAPLRCNAMSFLLVAANGNALMPRAQWCDVPFLAPKHSAGFSATFPVPPEARFQLRFEHPDGTYEVHRLTVPPA